jgi:hypothetical protein
MNLINGILKEVYRDKNGILYEVVTDNSFSSNSKAIVYTNGSQLDHYTPAGNEIGYKQFFKNNILHQSSNKTHNSGSLSLVMGGGGMYGHSCDWYDENHQPYIFKYIVSDDKDGMVDFSASLIRAISKINKETIIIGKSYGSVIGAYAASHPNVSKILAVNPCFLGSPLANPEIMNKFHLNFSFCASSLFTKAILETNRNFTFEVANGMEIPQTDKLTIIGGSIKNLSLQKQSDYLMKIGYNTIMYLSGEESDGMAIWNRKKYNQVGVPIIEMERPFHANSQDSEYMKEIFVKQLIKR